ncbi:hypothetical protein B0H16DRAFT_1482399 [Mycena metata]|uniref:Uncharacterized protein n=1 Tax=Mycena metata TaxID=1033252 RepID=A0AAD7GU26_9AGAR|nr:hypothetical protein B0H16DRAFT_1482399 [Mycena metata]
MKLKSGKAEPQAKPRGRQASKAKGITEVPWKLEHELTDSLLTTIELNSLRRQAFSFTKGNLDTASNTMSQTQDAHYIDPKDLVSTVCSRIATLKTDYHKHKKSLGETSFVRKYAEAARSRPTVTTKPVPKPTVVAAPKRKHNMMLDLLKNIIRQDHQSKQQARMSLMQTSEHRMPFRMDNMSLFGGSNLSGRAIPYTTTSASDFDNSTSLSLYHESGDNTGLSFNIYTTYNIQDETTY